MKDIDYALEILQATHDGNDLTPRELKLVEDAANHFLNAIGMRALKELHLRTTRRRA